jgi:hypothetical protein
MVAYAVTDQLYLCRNWEWLYFYTQQDYRIFARSSLSLLAFVLHLLGAMTVPKIVYVPGEMGTDGDWNQSQMVGAGVEAEARI